MATPIAELMTDDLSRHISTGDQLGQHGDLARMK